MGQKVNPNILRLGKFKEWTSKYIEKKSKESSITTFRDLEIKKFMSQLFTKNNLQIQNYKAYYSENSLHIYISYYNTTKLIKTTNRIKLKPKFRSKLFDKKLTFIKKVLAKKELYLKKKLNKDIRRTLFHKTYFLSKKTQRLNAITNFQNYTNGKKNKTLNKQNKNLFISKILKSLNLFTNKKHNIFLNLKQINKETLLYQNVSKKNKHVLKTSFTKLRRFQENEFFKKGFNLLYNFITNQQNSTFLAAFIAVFLKKLKRPNFFLRFLKLTLETLIIKKFSKFKRIQIKIKGRFNGAPRSTHKFINMGKNIPILTLNSKIDYGEATAYTSNGTFGIKVWTYQASI